MTVSAMHDLRDAFDRVVVVSLARRPERWQQFMHKLPADWPFKPPLRFSAVDGSQVEIPSWWDSGQGAWGCYQSHLQIIEDCLEEAVESVLLLEDDAVFHEHFGRDVRAFLQNLPDDWQMIYLGGQHLEMQSRVPERVNDHVYRPYNVNRTHAYAIRGRTMLEKVHKHLLDTKNWKAEHHIDHHLGELHKQMATGLYVPNQWLVAQGAGKSDVNQRSLRQRDFRDAEELVETMVDMPMLAVVGPFSGGTSAVAGALHKLGVSMGQSFAKGDAVNVQGHFEAAELRRFCWQMFDEPWMTEKLDREARERLLRIWAAGHCKNHRGKCQLIGGKHPSFCFLGPELEAAWKRPVFLSVERDVDEVVNSLSRRNWGWSVESCFNLTQQMIASRDQFLATTESPVIRLRYDDLRQQPEQTLRKLCRVLPLKPSLAELKNATQFVSEHQTATVEV